MAAGCLSAQRREARSEIAAGEEGEEVKEEVHHENWFPHSPLPLLPPPQDPAAGKALACSFGMRDQLCCSWSNQTWRCWHTGRPADDAGQHEEGEVHLGVGVAAAVTVAVVSA